MNSEKVPIQAGSPYNEFFYSPPLTFDGSQTPEFLLGTSSQATSGNCDHQGSLELPTTTGELYVTVFETRGFKSNELFGLGKADFYAVIKVGGREVSTSVHENAGSEPVGKVFTFPINNRLYSDNEFFLSLSNGNPMQNGTLLGSLHLGNLGFVVARSKNRPKWYPISLDGKQRGQISLEFDFFPSSDSTELNSAAVTDSMGGGYDRLFSALELERLLSTQSIASNGPAIPDSRQFRLGVAQFVVALVTGVAGLTALIYTFSHPSRK